MEHNILGGETDLDAKAIAFNSLAREYDLWFENEGKLIFDIEVRAFQEIMLSLPPPWLEIGVGSGRFARALGIQKGIDPSSELLKIAQSRGIDTCLSSGERCPFQQNSFGTVFIIVTLCFVDSPRLVLKESHRILAPGGNVVLGLVLRESSWGKFYERKKQAEHRFYKHATFYRYNEVVTLLTQAGFSVKKVISTLFQRPQELRDIEFPSEGYDPDAGFTIINAVRK
ncbi:MAG: class I SAM-dependent methyltransferase [Dehalococcoidales bacterium]|nr:class I SAM-dependent methyltransferase [Dehalococcoidales bacterium]